MKDFTALTSLDAARLEIDRIDDAMLALLHERALVVEQVARLKAAANGGMVRAAFRPARELAMLRRLRAQCTAPLEFSMVYAVWREIVGGFTAKQAPLRIAAMADARADMRDTFGAAAEFMETGDAREVLAAVKDGGADLGILPAAEKGWLAEFPESGVRVICALPFLGARIAGYGIARSAPEPSGDDVTLALDDGQLVSADGLFGEAESAAMAEKLARRTQTLRVIGAYPRPLPLSDGP